MEGFIRYRKIEILDFLDLPSRSRMEGRGHEKFEVLADVLS